MKLSRVFMTVFMIFLAFLCFVPNAWAFCGFYVAKADAKLYNQASQVIIARDGDRTVLTMANDYQGDVKDFALVVPVPVVLQQEQVAVADPNIVERLDAFSAPRLVEYFDYDPCFFGSVQLISAVAEDSRVRKNDNTLGVNIEASFTVGEYDIVILSARESNGLETWLKQNNYKIPEGAAQLLQSYIRQDLKFFVAKVNLSEFEALGYEFLRPLQMAYESPRFMLPIRLGMLNATQEQDLIVYVLSPKGQAEVTNYRTVKIPSDVDIPVFVKNEFGDFYKSLFQTAYTRQGKNVAFLEYAWDMATCDPCSADPLNLEELRQAGVFWLDPNTWSNVFISRIHVRYTRDKFPEDLMFQETSNRANFQGRYVLRHSFTEEITCNEGQEYSRKLIGNSIKEAQNLARLTGWNFEKIRDKARSYRGSTENNSTPQIQPDNPAYQYAKSRFDRFMPLLGFDESPFRYNQPLSLYTFGKVLYSMLMNDQNALLSREEQEKMHEIFNEYGEVFFTHPSNRF